MTPITSHTLSDAELTAYFDLGHQGDEDRTQLRALLRLTPAERLRKHQQWNAYWRGCQIDPKFIDDIVNRLQAGGVEFIIVGGVCGQLHGSPRPTIDLDLYFRRTPENVRRLAAALAPLKPVPRDFPPGLPFFFNERTVLLGTNFTLVVNGDSLDLLTEMSAIGGYDQVIDRTVEVTLPAGRQVRILSLADLIASKQAADRPKDRLALADLIPLLEEQGRLADPQ